MLFAKRAFFICTLLVTAHGAIAQTWNGGSASTNFWTDGANWAGGIAPLNTGAANVIFGGNTRLAPLIDVAYSINSLTFNNTAGVFNINGTLLTVGAGGITNNDADIQGIGGPVNVGAAQTWSSALGSLSLTGNVGLNNTLTFNCNFNSSFGGAGVIAGTGGLIKDGAGQLVIAGTVANTFSGTVTVNAGQLLLNKPAGIDAFTGSLIIGDGAGAGTDSVLLNTSNQTDSAAVTVNSTGLFNVNNQSESITSLTMNGGSVTIGTGTLTNSGVVNMTGGSISSTGAGKFVLGSTSFVTNASANTATVSGTLDFASASRSFSINDGTALVDLDISAAIPNGVLNKFGLGTLRLSGSAANSASTQLIINSGTLELAKTGGAIAGGLFLGLGDFSGGINADVVRYLASQQLDPTTNVSINSAGFLDLNGFDQTLDHVTLTGGNINTGSGALIFTGSGITAALSTQPATIAGHLDLGDGARIISVADGAPVIDLDINAAIESATAAGSITKTGTGILTFSGTLPNTYTGTTTVNTGLLILVKSVANGAIPGDLIIGDGVGSDTVRLDGGDQIANTSNITIHSGGTLLLTNVSDVINSINFPDGNAIINSGLGFFGMLGNFSSAPANITSSINGILDLNAGSRSFDVGDGAALPDVTISSNIINGQLIKTGDGELQLSGNNSARFTLNQGTLLLASNTALGTLTANFNGGTIKAVGARTFANPIVLAGPVIVDGPDNLTLNGVISGAGGITKNGTATLTVAAGTSAAGAWILNNGTLASTDFRTIPPGSLVMNGGAFSGTLTNGGALTYNHGAFNGSLINNGTFAIDPTTLSFDVSGGLTNLTDMRFFAGQSINVSGTGIQNLGDITITGSTLTGPALIVNNGRIDGFGAISPSAAFTNNGLITQAGGNLDLAATLSQTNNGTIALDAGRQLRIFSTPLLNKGALNLNSGLVSGTQALNNLNGGTLTGPGTILTTFSNAGGLLLVKGNTLITSPFLSSSIIQLDGAGANLVGGKVTSSGTIHGIGNVSSDVDSSGTIEAVGGILSFSGTVNNSGTIGASAGNKVLFSTGLSSNTGIINLTGGTIDNNNIALTSAGQISGYGTFRALSFINNGSMTFSGGVSTINGNVINSSGKQIRVAYNPAIFTGNVTNNGIFKNTSTTITFAGTYTENGTFISDPADNYFSNVSIGPGGAWVGGVGDRFFVAGDFLNQSTSAAWDTAAAELHLLLGGNIFQVNGRDLGVSYDGYEDNFSWGTLSLAAGRMLTLIDADSSPGGAVYVDRLDLQGGIDQISAITGNGMTLYYSLGNPNNAYLGGKSYQLAGGGSIRPVPEPAGILLGLIAAPLMFARRAHRRRRA